MDPQRMTLLMMALMTLLLALQFAVQAGGFLVVQ